MNRIRATRRRRDRGFSAVEAIIAATLLTLLFSAAFGAVVSGSRAVETGITSTRLESRARAVVDRIAEDLRSSRVEPILDNNVLRFRKLHGSYQDGFADVDFEQPVILWAGIPESRYVWSLEPGEDPNGMDDDGDGRVDEGRLSFRTPDGVTSVIARDVPSGGFVFQMVGGSKLRVRLALEVLDREGERVRDEAATTVFLRN